MTQLMLVEEARQKYGNRLREAGQRRTAHRAITSVSVNPVLTALTGGRAGSGESTL